jgi:hypothetical protein
LLVKPLGSEIFEGGKCMGSEMSGNETSAWEMSEVGKRLGREMSEEGNHLDRKPSW